MDKALPLNAIRAFEAAGRLSSIAAAAGELHVTPAAVSHQIKSLEAHLGVPLFVRSHRSVTLTPAGRQYLTDITAHLAGIRRSTTRVMESGRRRVLRIQAHATVAMRWLIPRLSGFHAAHPEISVSLITAHASAEFDEAQFDCAIKLGNGRWKGLSASPLVRNELAPACSPALLRKRPHLKRVEGLAKETLLHSLARPDDWSHWLNAQRVTAVDAYGGLKYESSVLAYQAAIEGHGIAIAQKALIDADVALRRLTYLFPKSLDMGAYTYYFVCPDRGSVSRELTVFREWVTSEAERR